MTEIITEQGVYVVPACPSWSLLPADHDTDDKIAYNGDPEADLDGRSR